MIKNSIIKVVAGTAFSLVSSITIASATRQGQQYDDNSPTGYLLAERSSGDVECGVWNSNLDKCIAFAEANGVPLVAIWSNGDNCGHCKKWENNALSDTFEAWMKTSGIVFYFGYHGDPPPGQTLGTWCYWCGHDNPKGVTLPLVRFYWPKGNVDFNANGDTADNNIGRCSITSTDLRPDEPYYRPGDYDTYNMGGRFMAEFCDKAFPGYDHSGANSYFGGEFGVADAKKYPNAGLLVERTTSLTSLAVYMTRTNTAAQAHAYTNYVRCIYPNGTRNTYQVPWPVGKSTSNRLNIDISQELISGDSDYIRLKLLEDNNEDYVEDLYIGITSESLPNSPKNPLWVGERTEDTLPFGKWTMDLDVATNKVAKYNAARATDKAYTMVLVSGSLWCPDCVLADHYFYDYKEDEEYVFRNWARDHNIALVVLDIPNYQNSGTETGTSLLSVTPAKAGEYWATGRGQWTATHTGDELVLSGAGYLSRHGASMADAATVAARNKDLVGKDTANGGLNIPGRSNPNRTGVPSLILLREDGTVAGRFDSWSNVAPKAYDANVFKRLEELLEQADDASEAANESHKTTKDQVSKRGIKSGTLSHADLTDVYKIETSAVGQTLNFTVKGEAAVEGAVDIVQVSGSAEKTLATATGLFTDALSVSSIIPSDNCYLVVRAARASASADSTPKSAFLAAASASSTVFGYSISSDNLLSPGESAQTETVTDGNPSVTLELIEGTTYRITNLDPDTISEDVLVSVDPDASLYVAKTGGAATLTLLERASDGSYATEYQIWKTGQIGFARTAASVSEGPADVVYSIQVARTGGVAGEARATIWLDDEASCKIRDGSIFEWNNDGYEFVWPDGSSDVKTVDVRIKANAFADDNQLLVFNLRMSGGTAGVNESQPFTLTVKDDDEATAGTLAITGVDTPFDKPMSVVAAKGSSVLIDIARLYGTDGDAIAVLTSTAGVFENGSKATTLEWESRSNEVKRVALSIPAAVDTGSIQVTLTSISDAKVDNARKYLTIKIAECEAAFESGSRDVAGSAYRYVHTDGIVLKVDGASVQGAGEVEVRKYSGSIPSGMEWSFDKDSLEVEVKGTPSKAGEWTAVFRVFADGEGGGTAALTISVTDPAVAEDEETKPLNGAVAVTRTIKDIIVMDSPSSNLVGLLTITIPPSGRLSAKFRDANAVSTPHLSEEWDDIDEDGTLMAELRNISVEDSESTPYTFTVSALADGKVQVECVNSEDAAARYICAVPSEEWSVTNPATDWKGYYTVNMPQTSAATLVAGPGLAVLKMTTSLAVSNGKMTYAGILPNGKAFSGVAVLAPQEWNGDLAEYQYAYLPVIHSANGDLISGIFRVTPGGAKKTCQSVFASSALFQWRHSERNASAEEYADYDTTLDVFGSAFDKDEDLAYVCDATFQDEFDNLKFFALTDEIGSVEGFSSGKALKWDESTSGIRVWNNNGVNKIKLRDAEAAKKANGLVFTFNRSTGLVNGSFKIVFEDGTTRKASFKGVVKPWWGNTCGVCQIGALLDSPFISGPAWFTDECDYGGDKTIFVRRGCSFSVGVEPGK